MPSQNEVGLNSFATTLATTEKVRRSYSGRKGTLLYSLFAWNSPNSLSNQLIQFLSQTTQHYVVAEIADLRAFPFEVDGRGTAP